MGGTHDIPKPLPVGYSLSTIAFGDQDRLLLVAEIRLYANAHTPLYHVVVGDVIGHENVDAALQKLDGQAIILSPEALAGSAANAEHWFPKVWPLPLV